MKSLPNCAPSRTHTLSLSYTHAHTLTHSLTHSHTHTHTHTQFPLICDTSLASGSFPRVLFTRVWPEVGWHEVCCRRDFLVYVISLLHVTSYTSSICCVSCVLYRCGVNAVGSPARLTEVNVIYLLRVMSCCMCHVLYVINLPHVMCVIPLRRECSGKPCKTHWSQWVLQRFVWRRVRQR